MAGQKSGGGTVAAKRIAGELRNTDLVGVLEICLGTKGLQERDGLRTF
jgi:hypothetical protein